MTKYKDLLQKTEEIIERLETLDILCTMKGIKAEIIILGGAAIFLLMDMNNRDFRPTHDIDINILSTTNEKEIYQLLEQVQIDIVGGVMELPPMEDFRDGKEYEIDAGFTSIRVYVPSIELLACSKIFTRREKDLIDLKNSDILVLCNPNKLMEMVKEYKENMLNPHDPNSNIHELFDILKEKGINWKEFDI